MMHFVVPQFLDVEDKIFGPISVRQFAILIVGAGFLFAAYRFADFSLFLLEALLIIIGVAAFGFVRVNGRPFHDFVFHILETTKKPRLRVWHHEAAALPRQTEKMTGTKKTATIAKRPLTKSRLAELSLVVDTGGAYRGEDEPL